MIFSISEYLGFSDDEILRIFREEDIEISTVIEQYEYPQVFQIHGN